MALQYRSPIRHHASPSSLVVLSCSWPNGAPQAPHRIGAAVLAVSEANDPLRIQGPDIDTRNGNHVYKTGLSRWRSVPCYHSPRASHIRSLGQIAGTVRMGWPFSDGAL
jgi:hypothetical protein